MTYQANFMGGILEGPWLRKGDNVFLGTIKDPCVDVTHFPAQPSCEGNGMSLARRTR